MESSLATAIGVLAITSAPGDLRIGMHVAVRRAQWLHALAAHTRRGQRLVSALLGLTDGEISTLQESGAVE